jgi:hypothetical protein
MSTQTKRHGALELVWETDPAGTTWYQLYGRTDEGQLYLISTFDQGPFDTALDVAQWAWRAVAREVPPAST